MFHWIDDLKPENKQEVFRGEFDPYHAVIGEQYFGNLIPDIATGKYKDAVRNGLHLWRLNPDVYEKLGEASQWSPEFAKTVLKPILELCQFRSTHETVLELPNGNGNSRLADEVPSICITTVELEASETEQKKYTRTTDSTWKKLGHVSKAQKKAKYQKARVKRRQHKRAAHSMQTIKATMQSRLSRQTIDPNLDKFCKAPLDFVQTVRRPRVRKNYVDCDQIRKGFADPGTTLRYLLTRDDDSRVPVTDRIRMIWFLVKDSPKMKWLLVKLWQVIKKEKKRVLIFCLDSMVQWSIEQVCTEAQFNVLSMAAHLTSERKRQVIDAFNNPHSKNVDLLILPMGQGGVGINLQNACCTSIIFELPPNVNRLIHAAGRIHRLGQTREQEVFIPILTPSYEDVLLARQAEKFIRQLCAESCLPPDLDGMARQLAAGEILRRLLGAQHNRIGKPILADKDIFDFKGSNYGIATRLGKKLFKNGKTELIDHTLRNMVGWRTLPQRSD